MSLCDCATSCGVSIVFDIFALIGFVYSAFNARAVGLQQLDYAESDINSGMVDLNADPNLYQINIDRLSERQALTEQELRVALPEAKALLERHRFLFGVKFFFASSLGYTSKIGKFTFTPRNWGLG